MCYDLSPLPAAPASNPDASLTHPPTVLSLSRVAPSTCRPSALALPARPCRRHLHAPTHARIFCLGLIESSPASHCSIQRLQLAHGTGGMLYLTRDDSSDSSFPPLTAPAVSTTPEQAGSQLTPSSLLLAVDPILAHVHPLLASRCGYPLVRSLPPSRPPFAPSFANPFNSVLSSRRARDYGVTALHAVSSAFAFPPAGGASSEDRGLRDLASRPRCGSQYSLLAPCGVL
ncbi:hypothetical protein FB451DRAFT_1387786 [Mycena latifolia]|nr:hypothetical protein FB451DRAFT_1387786 [Mycena latifolia]